MSNSDNNSRAPWSDPEWNGGHIRSQASLAMKALVIMAVFWNALCIPMAIAVWTDQPRPEPVALAAVSLFPLVGLGLMYAAVLQFLRWRRFGKVVLDMDPFPGSLGGDVGGSMQIPLRFDRNNRFEVILDCSHVRISRGSKNNSRSETVVWRDRGMAQAEPSATGTRLRFLFKVPADLPHSEPASDNYHHWQVHVRSELSGADLKSSFEIPVYDTGEALQSRMRMDYTAASTDIIEVPAQAVVMSRGSDHKQLFYPLRRNRGMGMILMVFALFWNGMVYGFGGKMWGETSDSFMGIMMIPFALIFCSIGALLAIGAVYTLFNSLRVRIYRDRIDTERRFFGIPFRNSVPLSDLISLHSRISSQAGAGADAKIYYSLYALSRAGKKIPLGDGIRGAPLAKKLRQLLAHALGGKLEWREETRGRLSMAKKHRRAG